MDRGGRGGRGRGQNRARGRDGAFPVNNAAGDGGRGGRGRGDGRGQYRGRGRDGAFPVNNAQNNEFGARNVADGRGYRNRGRDGGTGDDANANANGQRETHPMGLEKLKRLMDGTDADLLNGLTLDGSFYKLIDKDDETFWERRRLVLRVVARASQFNDAFFRLTLHRLLERVARSKFLLRWLMDDVMKLRNRFDRFANMSKEEREKLIEEASIVLAEILDKLPETAMKIGSTVNIVLDTLKDKSVFPELAIQGDDENMPSFRRVQKRLEASWNEFVEKQKNPNAKDENRYRGPRELEPLENFRELPILPKVEEIISLHKPRLRKIRKEGAYNDIQQYLDIQFRLLREDLIWPIRDAVNAIIERTQLNWKQENAQSKRTIRMYHVRFESPEFDKRSASLTYDVVFDTQSFKRVNWDISKRLLQGSLLCFTADGFRTLFFGTIFERKAENLKKGRFKVVIDVFPAGGLNRELEYTFVESPSFFEAYKHVLKALQAIRDERDMPFSRQLVLCDANVDAPNYIRMNPTIDMIDLIRPPVGELRVNDVRIVADWPPKERIGLDASQLDALRHALTKQLVIIQGPPGTGKTYIGLKIVRILLKKILEEGPLLLVCYTNHALDQFLEGIASFLPNADQSIVRIGGSAKMKEEMKQFQFRHSRFDRPPSMAIMMQIRDAKKQQKDTEAKMKATKKLTQERMTLLSAEQISELTDGRGKAALFDLAYRHTNATTAVDILHAWLSRNVSVNEEEFFTRARKILVDRLSRFTGFDEWICATAVRVTGGAGEGIAMEWLNGVFELTLRRFAPVQACFALELNRGDVDLAVEWLIANVDRNVNDHIPAPQERMAVEQGHEAALAQENEFDTADEGEEPIRMDDALDLERDFEDVVANDDSTDEEEHRIENLFASNGGLVQLPQFIWNVISRTEPMSAEEAVRAVDLAWNLPLSERWRLYRYWQQRWIQLAEEQQRMWEQEYKEHTERIRELYDLSMVDNLRAAQVIAMTTTGAAKKQAVLQRLQPKVIVIEEAAEILEAHIIASLSPGCEHLILIGDHHQLRPNPSVYELAKHYNLNISLFERLINNKFEYVMLNEQHRMRTEIANVLMPQFYEGLRNHESVTNRDHIKGMAKDIFFLDHLQLEKNESDTTSHKNIHEARFLVALCKYLIQQGYEANRITILACYLAQMYEIKRLVNSEIPVNERVRVSVVDNFQGEENDIILLSLVRSNEEGKIGFLDIPNRVCVALSRAKNGFYVVGNFQHLSRKCDLWKQLVERLTAANFIGRELELQCQVHGTSRMVKNDGDFAKKAPSGGCEEMCDTRLLCGHVCSRRCHPIDPEHIKEKCKRNCEKLCNEGHKCPKMCYETCGECKVKVKRVLACGHENEMQCYEPVEGAYCNHPCSKTLTCDHPCKRRCGDTCESARCTVSVKKRLPCGHVANLACNRSPIGYPCVAKVEKTVPLCGHIVQMACSTDLANYKCAEPCGQILNCEHPCSGTCNSCRQGRLHKKCEEACKRILICGHECKENCSKTCPPCVQLCENRCVHSHCGRSNNKKKAGGRPCGQPCPPCVEKCGWQCEHRKCDLQCYVPCKRPRCNEKCTKKLECQHDCIGVCGEYCPELCRQCNADELEEIIQRQWLPIDDEDKSSIMFIQLQDCKHVFEVNNLDNWFDSSVSTMNQDDAQRTNVEIKLLACPLCKTLVRTTQRYGAISKQCFLDVQQIKKRQQGDSQFLEGKRNALKELLLQAIASNLFPEKSVAQVLLDLVTKPQTQNLDETRLANLETFYNFFDQILKFKLQEISKLKDIVRDGRATLDCVASKFIQQFYPIWKKIDIEAKLQLIQILSADIAFLFEWISRNAEAPSAQMMDEFALEWRRTIVFARLVEFIIKASNRAVIISNENWNQVEQIVRALNGKAPLNAKMEKEATKSIDYLTNTYGTRSGLGISEQERIDVLRAMGYSSRGHWYKCPKGHIYSIGECGGAMVESNCPECGAKIGGQHHRLLSDNALASEMDGATSSAYQDVEYNEAAARRFQAFEDRIPARLWF